MSILDRFVQSGGTFGISIECKILSFAHELFNRGEISIFDRSLESFQFFLETMHLDDDQLERSVDLTKSWGTSCLMKLPVSSLVSSLVFNWLTKSV